MKIHSYLWGSLSLQGMVRSDNQRLCVAISFSQYDFEDLGIMGNEDLDHAGPDLLTGSVVAGAHLIARDDVFDGFVTIFLGLDQSALAEAHSCRSPGSEAGQALDQGGAAEGELGGLGVVAAVAVGGAARVGLVAEAGFVAEPSGGAAGDGVDSAHDEVADGVDPVEVFVPGQAGGIEQVYGIIGDVGVEVGVATGKADRSLVVQRPMVGSYSRAPKWYRPVWGS